MQKVADMKIEMIVAMAENRVIGDKGKAPWYIKEDLSRFKFLTTGTAVLMGRKTYESIGKALPNRLNMIVSNNESFRPENAVLFYNIEEAIDFGSTSPKIMIIGGGQIYSQCINMVDVIHITLIHQMTTVGDTFFPEIDPSIWIESHRIRPNPLFSYLTLVKR